MEITSLMVGGFVDSVAGTSRCVGGVVGRLIEESVELGIAAGLTPGEILSKVIDSLHKQAVKESTKEGRPVLPSNLKGSIADIGGECADVGLILKDVCYLIGEDQGDQERIKFNKLKTSEIVVSSDGTFYTKKKGTLEASSSE